MSKALSQSSGTEITYRYILQKAWPVVLANASVPLLGLSDTAVMGNLGSLADLGAIAFGAVIFSFVYWGFGFLRMGTTGFVAQALGADDHAEIRAALLRAGVMAIVIGIALMALQRPIADVSLTLMQGSPEVDALTREYIRYRIWGAPAALGLFALMGSLIGLGHSKTLLLVQLVLNGLNIALDILFGGVMQMGAAGIGLGTAVAEWTAVLIALVLVLGILRKRYHTDSEPLLPLARLQDWQRLWHTLAVNRDIMIRTLLLVAGFAWFVRQSANFGDDVLAANHILLQLISFSAFFLDAFAYVIEALAGRAAGARNLLLLDTVIKRSTILSAICAAILGLVILFAGALLVRALSQHPEVWAAADEAIPYAALYVALAFAAFQLDGIFIGTTRTRQMRNAAIISSAIYLLVSLALISMAGSKGLWLAFIVYVCARAAALLLYLPELRASVTESSSRQE